MKIQIYSPSKNNCKNTFVYYLSDPCKSVFEVQVYGCMYPLHYSCVYDGLWYIYFEIM